MLEGEPPRLRPWLGEQRSRDQHGCAEAAAVVEHALPCRSTDGVQVAGTAAAGSQRRLGYTGDSQHEQINVDDRIETRLHVGSIISRVETIKDK